jgi:sortase A
MTVPTAEDAPPAEGSGPARTGHRLGPVRRGVRELGLALITAGVIILLFVAYQLWGTGIAEAHSQATLKRGFNAAVAAHIGSRSASGPNRNADNPTLNSPSSPSAASGGAIDHLVVPRIHLDVFVVEGVSEDDLRRGPGHYPQTVLPGQDGNAAIAGHRTTYGAPFFSLNDLSVGDTIALTDTDGRTFVYRVSEPPKVVSPGDVAVLRPTSLPELTLTTCNPRYSASSRLVVVAHLAGQPPLPVTHVANTGPMDNLGRGDRGAWPSAIAYGLFVVALWIGVRVLINRTRRWARAGAVVGGIAVCLVPLWFCFENVVRLLPQNI